MALCQVRCRRRERPPMDTAQASLGLVRLQKIVAFRDYLSRHQKAPTSREEIAILGAVEDLLERLRRSLSAEALRRTVDISEQAQGLAKSDIDRWARRCQSAGRASAVFSKADEVDGSRSRHLGARV